MHRLVNLGLSLPWDNPCRTIGANATKDSSFKVFGNCPKPILAEGPIEVRGSQDPYSLGSLDGQQRIFAGISQHSGFGGKASGGVPHGRTRGFRGCDGKLEVPVHGILGEFHLLVIELLVD